MRRVARLAAIPADLALSGAEEMLKAQRHYQPPPGPASDKPKAYEFKAYKVEGVRQGLEAMFGGKCAYCETVYASTAPVDIEHYRPKGAVEDEGDHPGYWWLAAAWDNLLPSCIDCNRRRKQSTPKASASLAELQADRRNATRIINSGKKDSFPIAGRRAKSETDDLVQEQPLLLDPCRENPMEHLAFHIDHEAPYGLVFPRTPAAGGNPSERGAVSIQIYGLNRLGLVQERTRILRRLEFHATLLLDIAGTIEDLERDIPAPRPNAVAAAIVRLKAMMERIAGEIRDMAGEGQPYAAMVGEWIASFERRVRGTLPAP
jgi:uncharacterized protein (TIGR02646 family)